MISRLYYITNTRIPSSKANTYQSFQVCSTLSEVGLNVEFLYPNRKVEKGFENIDPFIFYNTKNNFLLKQIKVFDFYILNKFSENLYRRLHSYSFVYFVLKYLYLQKAEVIFSRDESFLPFYYFVKKFGFLKNTKLFFESHKFDFKLVKYADCIDGIITINQYLKKLYIENGTQKNKILVAHDGVNIEEYKNIPTKEIKTNNILYIGNLFAWKGVYTLVDALKLLPEYQLTIIGGSEEDFNLLTKYVKYNNINNITFTGFLQREKAIEYIKDADILVLPNSAKDKMSFYTSPLKLFEYMAAKRVIVASDLPSLKEILTDKENAILFEPDNVNNLVEKLKYAIDVDTSNMIKKASHDVLNFTWEQRAKNIKKFMEDIINEK